LRDLGISPGQQASVSITNGTTTASSGTGTGTTPTNNALTFNNLRHLNSNDYSVTLPSATANAVLTDTYTKIIQNPEIRSVDGQTAKLKIGDRIPVATGSFQAGVGVGAVGVNPLVNTQFTYLDVGVNVDITPRVHPDHEVSLKVVIDVSSQTGTATIGGIVQPIISQRKIEQDIRLKEGEANILGGLFERTDTRTLNGWPGLAKIPFLRYFFSDDRVDHEEDEVLLVLTPRIVRMPEWTKANLRPLFSGTETNVQVKRMSELRAPEQQPTPQATAPPPAGAAPGTGAPVVAGPAVLPASAPNSAAKLRFEPQTLSLKVGQTGTIGVVVENVNDLFSIPMLLQYNPAVISIEEVQHAIGEGGHAGFLSGGNQEIAIVSQPFKDKGQMIISATRQPNTAGVSGTGTLVGIVVKALAPGSSTLSIVQVSAKDSQQRVIPLVTGEATLQVQP
jgi:general secretion pathway protein D